MDHPLSVENIRRKISPAKTYEAAFEKDELEWIWKQAFTFEHSNVRQNANGTVLIAGRLDRIYQQFKTKFDQMLGPEAALSPSIGGNFYITPQQYGLHNDSIRIEDFNVDLKKETIDSPKRKYTCWKNILVPLWFGTNREEKDAGQVIFLEQRHIDWAHVYNNGNTTTSIASIYKIADTYADLQFYNRHGEAIPKDKNTIPFDKDDFKNYMNTPYRRLEGLSLESAIDWVPGNAVVFDAVQLHCSNEGSKKYGGKMWNAKMGLFLSFLVELDADLLELWRKEQNQPQFQELYL